VPAGSLAAELTVPHEEPLVGTVIAADRFMSLTSTRPEPNRPADADIVSLQLTSGSQRNPPNSPFREAPGKDLAPDLFRGGDVTLLSCLRRRIHRSPFSSPQPMQLARLQSRSYRIVRVRGPALSIFTMEARLAQKEETTWLWLIRKPSNALDGKKV
jgi:hypothetical protein